MLSEVYNCFTEGFDTTDLKEAKMVLDELSNQPAMFRPPDRVSTKP